MADDSVVGVLEVHAQRRRLREREEDAEGIGDARAVESSAQGVVEVPHGGAKVEAHPPREGAADVEEGRRRLEAL